MSRTTAYTDLDEVRAPADIEEVAIRAGDTGVVVQTFERPAPAVMVEYADDEGQAKALVIYSPDLSRLLQVLPEPA